MVVEKNTFIQKNKHLLILLGIFGIGIIGFALLTFINHRVTGTDDVIFPEQILPYSTVVDWVTYRYQEWSGRVFSEAFVYIFAQAPFLLWQFIAVLMYAVSSIFLFLFYRLFTNTRTRSKDYIMAIAALGLPFLMHTSVMSDGFTWMTGSIVYMWMATLALVALYPLFYYTKTGRLPAVAFIAIGTIATIVAASSQEQVGAVLLGLCAVLFGYNIFTWFTVRKVKFPWYLAIIFTLICASFAFSVLAPGNKIRLEEETIRWLPDYYTTPILERFHYSYRWFIEAFINHTGFLLIFIWALMAALIIKKPKVTTFNKVVASSLILLIILTLSHSSEPLKLLFDFKATWKPDFGNILASLNVIPWGIALIATAFIPLLIFKNKLGCMLTILFLASFASAAIITLSPTLYASGWRSVFISSMILVVIAYIMLDKVIDAYVKHSYIFAITIVGLALLQYTYQTAHLIKTAA